MNVKNIILEKDLSPDNLIKDKEDKIVGFKRSEYTCKVYFDNESSFYVPLNEDIANILMKISGNEDYKYPPKKESNESS